MRYGRTQTAVRHQDATDDGAARTPDGRSIADAHGQPLHVGDRVLVTHADGSHGAPAWLRRVSDLPCIFRGQDPGSAAYGTYLTFDLAEGCGPEGQTGFTIMTTRSRDAAHVMDIAHGRITCICTDAQAQERERAATPTTYRLDRCACTMIEGVEPAWDRWSLRVTKVTTA